MSPSAKKAINTISYALNVFFIVALLFGLYENKQKGPKKDNTLQSIKDCIIERERADLPLKIQQFEKVYGITINDIVLTNNVEPYAGYLITTWDLDEKQELTTRQWAANGYADKYVRKQKEVYVEIMNIKTSKSGEVSWNDNWFSAYLSVKDSN